MCVSANVREALYYAFLFVCAVVYLCCCLFVLLFVCVVVVCVAACLCVFFLCVLLLVLKVCLLACFVLCLLNAKRQKYVRAKLKNNNERGGPVLRGVRRGRNALGCSRQRGSVAGGYLLELFFDLGIVFGDLVLV